MIDVERFRRRLTLLALLMAASFLAGVFCLTVGVVKGSTSTIVAGVVAIVAACYAAWTLVEAEL